MKEFLSGKILLNILSLFLIFTAAIAEEEETRGGPVNVQFIPLDESSIHRDEGYIRPLGASKFSAAASPFIPRDATTTCSTEQVHVTLGDTSDSVFITFVNGNASANQVFYSTSKNAVQYNFKTVNTSAPGTSNSYSQLLYINSYLYKPAMGAPLETESYIVQLENTTSWAYSIVNGTFQKWANYKHLSNNVAQTGITAYNNPYVVYDSQIIHVVTVTGLLPGVTYYYKPVDSCRLFSFKMPPKAGSYPLLVGIAVDIGQTAVSNASINALITLNPAVVLCPGDFSYADGFYALWDTFGNLFEPLASKIPVVTSGGNHEFGDSEQWLSYMMRYPTPHKGSGSTNFCYYGKVIGVMHVISLCSYAGFNTTSLQYMWLESYLSSKINRTETPWLVTIMHGPWYSSNTGHWMEGELMRRAMEPLLFHYGVDIVICGHVHSYERTLPIYNNQLNECGITHLTIGDAGNYEGAYTPWRLPRPKWSAFREASFGVASIQFLNDTTAKFSWHRHACNGANNSREFNYGMNFSDDCVTPDDNGGYNMSTSDITIFTRPPKSVCPNRWVSTLTYSTPQVAVSPTGCPTSSCSTSDSDYVKIVALAVSTAVLGLSTFVLAAVVFFLYMMKQVHRDDDDDDHVNANLTES